MERKNISQPSRGKVPDAPRYDFGYQSVHFHLKDKKRMMTPTQIMMAVVINGRRYRVYTRLKAEPAFWDTVAGRCRCDDLMAPRARTRMSGINEMLSRFEKKLDVADMHAAEQNRYLTLEDLRGVVMAVKRPDAPPSDRARKGAAPSPLSIMHDLADGFDADISENGLKGSASSRRTYLYCWQRLSDFVSATSFALTDFSKLDRSFYKKYTLWLNERRQYSASTVQISVNCIRNLHHKAFTEGYTTVPDCREAISQRPPESGTKVYLTEDELVMLRKVSPSTKGEAKALDVFLLSSYTGLRFSDISRLDEAVISEGVIRLFQKKTHGFVSVPVLKEVGAIIMKYHQSPDGFPKLNQGYVNKVIKSLCRKAGITDLVPVKEYRGGNVIVSNRPKYEMVSFHTARRSCITNLYRRGYSPNYIMTMSGHKSISSFQRYIKSSEEELAADFLRELKRNKDLQQ